MLVQVGTYRGIALGFPHALILIIARILEYVKYLSENQDISPSRKGIALPLCLYVLCNALYVG